MSIAREVGGGRGRSQRARFQVGRVLVDAVQMGDAVARVHAWIAARECGRFIAVSGMHSINEAEVDAAFRRAISRADLVVADGTPLVWAGRLRGFPMRRRVYGPELMRVICAEGVARSYRHYLYGGVAGVAERLARALEREYPGILIVGCESPPFRALSAGEERDLNARIIAATPDIIWVGMTTPKQVKWMAAHGHLRTPVMVGVGAAFDFLSGSVRQAPAWVGDLGLEWLFRLCTEPRRLWRRYVFGIPQFLYVLTRQALGRIPPPSVEAGGMGEPEG